MEKRLKQMRIAYIVLMSIALTFIVAGTIISFTMIETYTYNGYVRYIERPDCAIMPGSGLVVLIIAFALCIAGKDEKFKLLIGSIILSIACFIVEPASYEFDHLNVDWDWVYFGFLIPGASLIFVCLPLLIASLCYFAKGIRLEKPKDKEKQNNIPADKFEEVRKYKQLLDEGIITPEEYDAKKKEILSL